MDGERAAQADPVLGVLNALGDLPAGWRGLSQLVVLPAAENWCRDYQRFAVQHPLEPERVPAASASAGPTFVFLALLVALGVLGVEALVLVRAGNWTDV